MTQRELEEMFDRLVEQFDKAESVLNQESLVLDTFKEMHKLMDQMFIYLEHKFNQYG